ncbi:pyridoxal phosphate-dependent aminotransferase [Cedecea davisae]|uniref:pyridoxal phosphate-dependent aminotransferase n=1 Tax=Cedecea davisae TaxID=158484 RepID=UPI001D0B8DED|nr:pyridoxal phosphate-dependent aminotransferase [Cedecea davisae]
MQDIRKKMNPEFSTLQGGLFSSVKKADVGTAILDLMNNGVDMLCWADPFFPDHVLPQHIADAVSQSMVNGSASHYTMPIGNPYLKEKIAEKLKRYNHLNVDPQRNILITPGSDSGLLFAMMPFINKGDEVLIHSPSYPSNFLNVELLGGKPVSVELKAVNNYQIDIAAFEEKLSAKTKMVVLTNPNNPTGTVFRRESLEQIADFVIRHDLVLVVDQAFEDAIFDDIDFCSVASLPGMWERTVSVFSFSKGMGLSGFRVGYLVADDRIMDVLFGCTVNVLGATNTSSQAGMLAALDKPQFMDEYIQIFDTRRKKVFEIINSIPGVSMALPESGFLSWIDISRLGGSAFICDYLLEHARVIVNAGTPYGEGGEGFIRLVHGCYKDDDKLYAVLNKIKEALTLLAQHQGITND